MPGRPILTIDSGGSKSDFVLLTDTGKRLARASAPGTAALHSGLLPVADSLRLGIVRLGVDFKPSMVFCSLGGPNTAEVEEALRDIFPAARIVIERESTGRMVLFCAQQHHAAAACLCGTGSVAFGQFAEGAPTRLAGGWGPVYGDEGSGGGLGVAALKRILSAVDAGESPSILPGCFPGLTRPKPECPFAERMVFKDAVNNLTRTAVAAEAPRIADLAASGDVLAMELLREAAAEIARLAATVTPSHPWGGRDAVLALGGFVRLGKLFRTLCDEALRTLRPEHHFSYEPFQIIDAACEYALHLNRETDEYID